MNWNKPRNIIYQAVALPVVTGLMLLAVSCVPMEKKEMSATLAIGIDQPSIRGIYNLQQRQDIDSLLLLLDSENPSDIYAVARAFASIKDSSVLEALLPHLANQHDRVRAMVAEAIGQIGSSRVEGDLTTAFDGRDSARLYETANGAILEAMGKVGSLQFLRLLSTISTYTYTDTLLLLGQARGIYRYATRGMAIPEGTATMVNYLADDNIPMEVRIIAANYLHRAQGIDLAPHAEQLTASWHGESQPYIRMCLATALGKLKKQAAMKLLLSSLGTESDYRVKCNIIRSLQAYPYGEVSSEILALTRSDNRHVAETAAEYFVNYGVERDVARYRSAMADARFWQVKALLAEATNKHLTSMFTAAKISLQNEIQSAIKNADDPYAKAAWLKAWGAEIRNFESLPKYFAADEHSVVRIQAVSSLIDACTDKKFDAFFAGEGHLIRNQIGGYLGNALKSGDAALVALVAGAVSNEKSGLKSALADYKDDFASVLGKLKLPDELETYIEVSNALAAYGVQTPDIPNGQKNVPGIDWNRLLSLSTDTKVQVTTTAGDIVMEIYPDRAPGTVSSFLHLVDVGFYKGKVFHRVVPNFVIQTGCPRGDGFGNLDFTLRSEVAGAYYDSEGYVGMASAGPHTEGTQFFITHSPTPHLDGRYTIFGKVISGMDVVHRISIGDTIRDVLILN